MLDKLFSPDICNIIYNYVAIDKVLLHNELFNFFIEATYMYDRELVQSVETGGYRSSRTGRYIRVLPPIEECKQYSKNWKLYSYCGRVVYAEVLPQYGYY
jgi:hypothetical protein